LDLVIFLFISFAHYLRAKESIDDGRLDPNYVEEYRQVIDASLRATVAFVGKAPLDTSPGSSSPLSRLVDALSKLKIVTKVLYDCTICSHSHIPQVTAGEAVECKNSRALEGTKVDILVLFYAPEISQREASPERCEYSTGSNYSYTRMRQQNLFGEKLNVLVVQQSNTTKMPNMRCRNAPYQSSSSKENAFCAGRAFDTVLVPHATDAMGYGKTWMTRYGSSHAAAWSALYPPQAVVFPSPIPGKARSDMMALEDLKRVFIDGVIASTFKLFVRTHMSEVRSLPVSVSRAAPSTNTEKSGSNNKITMTPATLKSSRGRKAAIIIEPRVDFAFEFCVRNVMHHLGPSWGLIVYHSYGVDGNEAFVRSSLQDLPNTEFIRLTSEVNSGDSYNTLVKSPDFWKTLRDRFGLWKVLLFQSDSVMLRKGIEVRHQK
jgi:hypothetical protein